MPELGQERRWTLAHEEADLRGNKLKWNAVIIMHELGCCEAQGGSKGGRGDSRRVARGELASMQCETGIRFELTDGSSQKSQRRRHGQECNTKLMQKPVMEGTMNVSN